MSSATAEKTLGDMIFLNVSLAVLSAVLAWATRRSSGLLGQAAIWVLCVIAAIPLAVVLSSLLLGGPDSHGAGEGAAAAVIYVAMWVLLAVALSVVIAGAMWFVCWRQGAAARLVVGLWATVVFGLTAFWGDNIEQLLTYWVSR